MKWTKGRDADGMLVETSEPRGRFTITQVRYTDRNGRAWYRAELRDRGAVVDGPRGWFLSPDEAKRQADGIRLRELREVVR